MEQKIVYNCIFKNYLGESTVICAEGATTIEELIHLFFKKKEKENLFINNIEKTYFIYNNQNIEYLNNKKEITLLFKVVDNPRIWVCRLDYDKKSEDIIIIKTIKDNVYTCVYEAKYGEKIVAVKKIKKEQLKEDLKESLVTDEITDEDFKEEIIKFNRELTIMQKCHCENSVEIYDYFDTEKDFVIIMELCDNTLFKEMAKTKKGFSPKKIKEILL